jgi:hypothetical protein
MDRTPPLSFCAVILVFISTSDSLPIIFLSLWQAGFLEKLLLMRLCPLLCGFVDDNKG